jgi:catechol 2,3-dioxygenase-like lactoylglutathione lyase family enzyme
MSVRAIQHINIKCADLETSRAFYTVVGVKEGYRPPFSSKGFWMYLDNQPLVHLVQTLPEQRLKAEETAKFHIAFESDDIEGMRRALRDRGVVFKEALVPLDNSTQFFMHDPDGIQIELNFPNLRTEPQV